MGLTVPTPAGQEQNDQEETPAVLDQQVEDTPNDDTGEEDKEILFSLNGVDYKVPKVIGPNVSLAYMRDIRRKGVEEARAGILERILGPEALDALADYEDLTEEEFQSVMDAVDRHVLGPLEKQVGKGRGKGGLKLAGS